MLKKTLAILLLGLPLAAFPSKTGLSPGLYEYATSTDGAAPEKTRHCITPEEADRGIDPPPVASGCHIDRHTLAGGHIEMLETCKDSTMKVSGTYTATSFVMDGQLQAKVGNQMMKVSTHTVASRVRDACKAGDE